VLNNQAYAYCINFMLDGPNHLFICCETAAVNASAYRLHEYRYVVIDLKYRPTFKPILCLDVNH